MSMRFLVRLGLLLGLIFIGSGCADHKTVSQPSEQSKVVVHVGNSEIEARAEDREETQASPDHLAIDGDKEPASIVENSDSKGQQSKDLVPAPTSKDKVIIKTQNPVNAADAEAAISEIDSELDRLVKTLEAIDDLPSEALE